MLMSLTWADGLCLSLSGGVSDSKDAQEEAMAEVAALEGDHVTLVNLYAAYLEAGKAAEWCQERFINHRSLQR